ILKETINTVRINGFNTTGQTSVSTVEGNGVTDVKTSAGCVWRPKMTVLNNVSKDSSGSWTSIRVKLIDPQGRLNYKSSNDKVGADKANDATGTEKVQEPVSEKDQALKNVLNRMMNQEKEATKQSDAVRKEFKAQ
nr:hypothetical protein [Tanacetum cinerariifolium]